MSVLNIEIIQFKIQGKGFNINILVVKNVLYALLSYVWNYLFNYFLEKNTKEPSQLPAIYDLTPWTFKSDKMVPQTTKQLHFSPLR